MLEIAAIRERLRQSLWFVPGLFAAGAVVLALALVEVDRGLADGTDAPFLFGGTADGARSVLGAIAQSLLTFTGLVFSVTMLVLQLASSQLSPRVMRTFLRDRGNQVVLGLFVATFLYTLLVLREVRTPVDGDAGFVPGLAIFVAFVLLVASVVAFIWYIDHMAHAIRATTVLDSIADETRRAVDRLFPERIGEAVDTPVEAVLASFGRPDVVLKAERSGSIIGVDEDDLLAVATGDRRVELVPSVGDHVAEGSAMFRVWGTWDQATAGALRGAVAVGSERTLEQDAAFGIRQIVDIAVRALSPGVNDPTTAVQALDRIHEVLRRMAGRDVPSPVRADDDGTARVVLHRPSWDAYVRSAVDEIRIAGEGQLAVARRLRAMLLDLLEAVPDTRQPVLREQLLLLDASIERGFRDEADRELARRPTAGAPGGVSG